MPRYIFEEVSVKGVRKFKDPLTGKVRQETKKFMQTLNPFNRGADGLPKSREQITGEIRAERDAWLSNKGVQP